MNRMVFSGSATLGALALAAALAGCSMAEIGAEFASTPQVAETRAQAPQAAPQASPQASPEPAPAPQIVLAKADAPAEPAALPARMASPAKPADCKTVKLFEPVRPKVVGEVPAEWKAFLGHWGPGKWDGKLCHELVVEEIRADGVVRIADLQGWYTPWNRWPTAFRREARFQEDGSLRVDQGRMGVSTYRLVDGVLYGAYSWGASPLHVALVKKK